jgi:hypothetical protein
MRTPSAVLLGILASAASAAGAVDLLPDLTIDADWLLDRDVSWGVAPGCAHLRLAAATPNVGSGPLAVYGAETNPDGSQDVYQRVFRDDGTWWDRLAGAFVFHPPHAHVHFEDWAVYRLRADAGGAPGEVVAESDKTSFCLLDSSPYAPELPGAPGAAVYTTCSGAFQGISVGWEDVYRKTLPGQSIPLCGIAGGTYWLEAEVDPLDRILEGDETNNAGAVLVTVGIPPPPACNDGIDNDGDQRIDFAADPECATLADRDEFASSGGCGLGPELVALPLLLAVRSRRARSGYST